MLLKDKRVFIVEDNLMNRSVMQFILEQQGATVEFERWGLDTCDRIRNFLPVDIILLDLMLPNGMSGFDVYDNIREMPECKEVPIMAVSAKQGDAVIPQAQSKGFSGFISKPIDRREFAKQIAAVIKGEPVWQTN